MILHISHGAMLNPDDPGKRDWFVVKPFDGETSRSIVDTPITHAMAVNSLIHAGRVVFELDTANMTVRQVARELIEHG